MSIFLRLLDDSDKANALISSIRQLRSGAAADRTFEVSPASFSKIPTSPFAYWVSGTAREIFERMAPMKSAGREAWMGLSTGANNQWLRLYWELRPEQIVRSREESREPQRWAFVAKGGAYSSFYQKFHVVVDWSYDGDRLEAWKQSELAMGRTSENNSQCWNKTKYFRPGVTWSARSQKGASFRVLPPNAIFGSKGPAIVEDTNSKQKLLAIAALANSWPFGLLLSMQMSFGSFEVGVIQRTPIPNLTPEIEAQLAALTRQAWSKKWTLDSVDETSLAFRLPVILNSRLGSLDPSRVSGDLVDIQASIDETAVKLYDFSDADRAAAQGSVGTGEGDDNDLSEDVEESEDEDSGTELDQTESLLSWAVGVAFGRFDWRLATGEREVPPEPDPFDPLPAKSPGMLPDGAVPFQLHSGILVDDQGHPHDLPRLIEEVLVRVDAEVPGDVRRWLQRDFFPLHLKQYSKSRRKAPIYWPLSTSSGSYTLWLYYPSLTSQTLYSAVNDFVEPKLKLVARDASTLRDKGSARSRDDEKAFEGLQSLELELIELRDTLLRIAPTYRPNHDDGVQITAAPLWHLFQHKPWQKVLKDTWTKLEKGDYDWAHLAMAYWPDRVREKCKTDKSLAIAHDLEELYVPSSSAASGKRKKKGGGE